MFELLLLFSAGLLGGMVNSIAGGGSFITFPALMFVGIPPVSANATNTFASCGGYLSGAYAFKDDLRSHKKELPKLIFIALLGGVLGAWLLLQIPEEAFRTSIPWLLLFATLLFIFGGRINASLKKLSTRHRHASAIGTVLLAITLFGICLYGGFFNAGQGIITLSYLALAGYTNINAMNGIKLLLSTVVALVAIVIFIYNDAIAWYEGLIVLAGALVGGFIAANLSKKLSQHHVRIFVILASIGITIYFFIDTYAGTVLT